MEPFMAILKDIQDAIIESQHVPGVNTICDCGSGLPRLFRCTECADFGVSCKECVLASHSKNPFHVIERHTGNFFERCGLASIGMRTHLLHNGGQCPYSKEEYSGVEINVIHTTGMQRAQVCFCFCPGHPSKAMQLIKSSLFPATTEEPRTAFTFAILKDFHLHTRTSKKASYDYLRAIRRKSDMTLVQDISVSVLNICAFFRL